MDSDEIQVELAGPHGAMDPRAIAEALLALDKILRHVDGDEPAHLNLSDLSVGSAKASIKAAGSRIQTVREGIAALAESPVIPRGWTAESVSGLVDLHKVANRRGVNSVALRTDKVIRAIDDDLADNAEQSLIPARRSLGSVRGVLYRYNRDQQVAGLHDYRGGRSIKVRFRQDLASELKAALDGEVEVWGEVARDNNDRVSEIRAQRVERLNIVEESTSLDRAAGLLQDYWPDGMDAAEWVSSKRD